MEDVKPDDSLPELSISPERVFFIIVKARESFKAVRLFSGESDNFGRE